MIEFKERGRGTKWHHRTPRARINRLGGDRVAYKEANWFKNNWEDDRAKWAFNGIERFLKVNIGRPVDKVFSEFLERCDKSTKSYNLKKIFYDHIKEKEDITWYGGFYVTNGILNYKKRTSRPKDSIERAIETHLSAALLKENLQLEQLTSGLKYPQTIVDAVNAKKLIVAAEAEYKAK